MRRLLPALIVGLWTAVALGQAHNAHWYNQEAVNGRFSVILNQPDGTESVVAVAREKSLETTILGIGTDMSFWRRVRECAPLLGCFPPNIILGIDKDLDGKYEADDLRWQWSLVDDAPGADPTLLHGDTFLQCEAQAPLTAPDPAFVFIDAYATYSCYHPDITGTTYDADYFPLSVYQLGGGAPDILPTSRVLALKVLAGGSGSWIDYSALVDVVRLGGAVRIDEPNNSRSHFEVATRH